MNIQPVNGQSTTDLTLQGYGNLNYFIRFLSDNLIASSSNVVKSEVYFDESLKNIDSRIVGLQYCTNGNNN